MKRVALLLSVSSVTILSMLGLLLLALDPPHAEVPDRRDRVFQDVTLVEPGRAPRPGSTLRTLRCARSLGPRRPLPAEGRHRKCRGPADLVFLRSNPASNVAALGEIEAVLADGRLYRRAELDAMLAAADAHFHGALYSGVMDAVVSLAQGQFTPERDGAGSFGGQP